MIGQGGPADRDLGDGGGRGPALLAQPERQGADEQAALGHAVEPSQEDTDELERERPPGPGRRI